MIGKKTSIKKIMTEEDIKIFAGISMDGNPVHLDEEYASKTIFKKRIVHGLYVSSLISAVIGNKLPGEGTIYLKQDLNFKKPVYINDEVTAEVEVLEMIKPTIYKLRTQCFNQDGDIVIDGHAIVKKD